MIKSNNVLLLKAVAMSALFINASIGTDSDDKYTNGSNKPSSNSRPHNAFRPIVASDAGEGYEQHGVAEILAPMDERARIAREVLSKPRTIDFAVSSIDAVLKLLSYAKQYSVKVKLNLLNVTESDFEKILSENDGDIEEIVWSYNATPVSLTQDSEDGRDKRYAFDTWYAVDGEEDDKENSLHYVRASLIGSDSKYIDDDADEKSMYAEDDKKEGKYIDDEKYSDDKYLSDDFKKVDYIDDDEKGDKEKYIEDDEKDDKGKYIEDDEKDKDDFKFLEDDEDEPIRPRRIQDRLPNLNRQIRPNDLNNLPIRRRAASRGLRAPDIKELLNNAGQKGTPLIRPAGNDNNGVGPQDEAKPTVVGWKFTTLKSDLKSQDSTDFLSTTEHSKPPKQPNLVRFYCHQDPILVRAQ